MSVDTCIIFAVSLATRTPCNTSNRDVGLRARFSCLRFTLTITLGGSTAHLLVHTERVLRVWVHGARVKSRV